MRYLRYANAVIVRFEDNNLLPNKPGIYIVTSSQGEVLYVGRALSSIRRRCTQKWLPEASHTDREVVRTAQRYDAWLVTYPMKWYGKSWIKSVEGRLIRDLKPLLNRRQEPINPLISAIERLSDVIDTLYFAIVTLAGTALLAFVITTVLRLL